MPGDTIEIEGKRNRLVWIKPDNRARFLSDTPFDRSIKGKTVRISKIEMSEKSIQLYDKQGNKLFPHAMTKPPIEFYRIEASVIVEQNSIASAIVQLVYSKNMGFVWSTVVLGGGTPKYYLNANGVDATQLVKAGDYCIMGDRLFIKTQTGLFELKNNI